jgi:hypothetical protein
MLASACVVLIFIGLYAQTGFGSHKLSIEADSQKVGKYEKIEFLIHLDTKYGNPFDPDEVDLSVELNPPNGQEITIPAFYYQHYEQRHISKGNRATDWLYPVGEPVWKALFAPIEEGMYFCKAMLKDRNGAIQSDEVSFECTSSQSKGFIRVSKGDPRFLEFGDGAPFFPIGQNLAFIGETQHVDLHRAREIFGKMSQNGANFARIWTCCSDWAMSIEARKSAWGRSWAWNTPVVLMPDIGGYLFDRKCVKLSGENGASIAVSPSHPVAIRPDTQYIASGQVRKDGETGLLLEINSDRQEEIVSSDQKEHWIEWKYEFATTSDEWWLHKMSFSLTGSGTAWLSNLSLKEVAGGPELLWEADVDRPVKGYYNPVDCFMLDKVLEAAEENGIYLQLCLLTRDLYMDLLRDENNPEYHEAIKYGKKILRYAVARWGYSTSVAIWEYFNEMNPNLPTDLFYSDLSDYLKQVDVYGHLRATSAWAPCEKDWQNSSLDVADLHWYLRPAWGELWKDEIASVIDRAQLLRNTASKKPALLSEFGLADDRWGLSPYMRQDKKLIHFHNSLWASALSGLSGTALFWWWEQLDVMDAYHHYRPLSAFLADVPFTTAHLRHASAKVSGDQVRVVGLQGSDCAYLWLSSSQAKWSDQVIDSREPDVIKGATLDIENLSPGFYYIQWWDTYEGKIVEQSGVSVSESPLRTTAPDFSRDIACKVTNQSHGGK